MKIIQVDNFDRENVSDRLICENVSEFMGKTIVALLNGKMSGDTSPVYFRLVEDNHKLYKFEP